MKKRKITYTDKQLEKRSSIQLFAILDRLDDSCFYDSDERAKAHSKLAARIYDILDARGH